MAKRKHSECGETLCFHGAFTSRGRAEAKAKTRKGARVISRRIGRQWRYIVVTGKESR
jgi:hypothetical protein